MAVASGRALILNVDDYEAARYARSEMLRRAGFDVIDAGSGAQALETAARRRPDLILLDVNLPDMDGFEVCRRLRAAPAALTVPIVLTSRADSVMTRLASCAVAALVAKARRENVAQTLLG